MKTTGLNFLEAVQAARVGHKIRRTSWRPKQHLIYTHNAFYHCCGKIVKCKYEIIYDEYVADDWESDIKTPKTMTFTKVVAGIKNSKKFRRLKWGKTKYLGCTPFLEGSISLYETKKGSLKRYIWLPTIEEIEATDWVEVKEKKR